MTFTLKHKCLTFPFKSPLKKINLENNSQGLSIEALRAKRERDKLMAMTDDRKKKKNNNQKEGQRSDSDIHHKPDGSTERVSVHANRGNFGKGTKSEG
jgi:lipid II:glycine glycyltransferase (peptidoglycan interpeptide bridge formation enzyme)